MRSEKREFSWVLLAWVCLSSALCLGGTAQTISFPAIPVRESTAGSFNFGATASSGLPVEYQVVGGAGVVSVAGSTVTLTGATGAYTIKATQAGNATFDPATAVLRIPHSFLILREYYARHSVCVNQKQRNLPICDTIMPDSPPSLAIVAT